jgi:hypothetical protein
MDETDLQKLTEPFAPSEIEWRVQKAGLKRDGTPYARVLAYVTARAIHRRLDRVCGPLGWRNEQPLPIPGGGFVQGLAILVDGMWLAKWDGADNTNVEPIKGGLSGSFKRAAALWGIGRYLYDLPDHWATVRKDGGRFRGEAKGTDGQKVRFTWDPPLLPDWALPKGQTQNSPKSSNVDRAVAWLIQSSCADEWVSRIAQIQAQKKLSPQEFQNIQSHLANQMVSRGGEMNTTQGFTDFISKVQSTGVIQEDTWRALQPWLDETALKLGGGNAATEGQDQGRVGHLDTQPV